MTREVPARARELAARLAALFRSDSGIVERLNDAQGPLRDANDRLWSGLHPDALGLVYDDADGVVAGRGASAIAGRMTDPLRTGGRRESDPALLEALQQTHYAIRRAFHDYQSACEERRQLAVDVGELSQQLTEALMSAGWAEQAARDADVHELAGAGAAVGAWERSR
jgi:hypothetical protein